MRHLSKKQFTINLTHTLLLLVLVFCPLATLGVAQTSTLSATDVLNLETRSITVKEGDSLATLATAYGMTVSDLMKLNMLDSTFIKAGLSLFVPVLNSTILATSNTGTNTGTNNRSDNDSLQAVPSNLLDNKDNLEIDAKQFRQVTVPQNATLSDLAIKYGSSIESIQSYNQLSGDTIYTGQILQIPLAQSIQVEWVTQTALDRQPDINGYITVLPNDTISALATTFCSSPELLLGQNNLTSPDIYVGQRLFVGHADVIAAMLAEISTNTIASVSNSTTLTSFSPIASLSQETTP